ncbi:MAG: SsrA-binding protein SmpB [Proteobacteria bacterium]|nr:SsrA-binding protein SmpB [Pseudomonadota bacterium]
MAKKKAANSPVISDNRRARFDYEVLEKIEAGIMLTGTEVKALREGQGQLTDAYATFKDGEMWLLNAHIAEYSHGNQLNHDPRRTRKLLLHKNEIMQLKVQREKEQLTIVPLRLYWAKGKVKVELAVARGKKLHDKRQTSKDRDWQRQKARILRS